jgi:hypothetical protein
MGDPIYSEDFQGTLRQGKEAVFGSLAAMNVNHHPLGVQVADLQVEPFFESQPECVGGPKEGGIVMLVGGGDYLLNFANGQHVGQRFLFGHTQFLKDIPISGTSDAIEKLQGAVGDFERPGRKLTIVDKVKQIVTDLLLGELIGWRVVVAGEFANFTEVAVVGSLGHALQLKVLAHAFP